MPILAPVLNPWWAAAAAWEDDAAAGVGAAVVAGDEEDEDEDEVDEGCAEFADLTTLAAAPAAPIKSFKGLEVVLAAAMLARSQVDEGIYHVTRSEVEVDKNCPE